MPNVRVKVVAYSADGLNRKLLRFRGFMLETYSMRPFLFFFTKHVAVISKVNPTAQSRFRTTTGPVTEREI